MRGGWFVALAALVIGCDVDRSGLSAGNEPTDTAVVIDTETDTSPGADTAVPPDTAMTPMTCGDAGAVCDDKDPCTVDFCDEGKCSFPLYQDNDGDGLQPNGAAPGCPKDFDCDDSNPEAFPGQTKYFSTHSDGAEFDYNCDGVAEQRWPALGSCTKDMGCTLKEGWKDMVPACGVEGEWISECGSGCVADTTVTRVQECR